MRPFLRILCATLFCFSLAESNAQCDPGFTNATLNWDLMKFLRVETYVTAAMETNQNFALGKSSVNLTYSGVTAVGESIKQTGKGGSFAEGADIEFSGNGTITLTFPSAVNNVRFSIQDVEKAHRVDLSASNAGVAQNVTLTACATSGSVLTINSTSLTNPYVTSLTGNGQTGSVDNTSNTGSFNVTIPGPVTTVTIISSNNTANIDFFLSDIHACLSSVFPSNYYQVSRPFTGQPGYILVAANKSVYMVDPVTGKAKFVFSDGATSGTLNSVAYDPVNKVIYYCWSLTNMGSANASGRSLYKYDFNTNTATRLLEDIRSIGIPTFDQGVESGAAAFYDGSLYLGIEGGADDGNGGKKTVTNRKSIIWRLDFTNGVPTKGTQVYSVDGDTHDWSDFSISNGMLYDFNGDATAPDYHHINMQTGAKTRYTYQGATPKQSAVGWDGTVYWVSNAVAPYNYNGTIGTQMAITANPAIPNYGTSTSPSFGDGAEAFRPQADFGDAPATYDPDPLAPALHEQDANLKFGTKLGVEWNKMSTTNTDDDDDGLYYVPILNQGGGVYQTYVKVYNNTGAPATVGGWMDFNGDNVFQPEEGVLTTVQTGTTEQMVSLYWTGITYNMPNNSSTFLRIRITSATNTMTKSSATGYFANGEVEDWSVLVNSTTLKVDLKSFTAEKTGTNKAKLNWNITDETQNTVYELQRSADGINWNTIYVKEATANSQKTAYQFTDLHPEQPLSYYRLKYFEKGDAAKYSAIQQLQFKRSNLFNLFPNPASDHVSIAVEAAKEEAVQVYVVDVNGKAVSSQTLKLNKGHNSFSLPVYNYVDGVYYVQLYMSDRQQIQKLIIKKK